MRANTPDKGLTKKKKQQSKIPSKSNLMNQWVFLGLFIEIWVRDYLQEQKWHSVGCISKPTQHDWQYTKLETWSTLKRQLSKVDGVLVQVDQLVFVFFWAIWLVSTLSRHVGLSALDSQQSLPFILLWREGPSESSQFQELPEANVQLFTSSLRSIPMAFHCPLEWSVVFPSL